MPSEHRDSDLQATSDDSATSNVSSDEGIDVISYQPSAAAEEKASSWSLLKVASLVLLAVLLFALWFVFTARSVWVQIEPHTDDMTVSGGLLQFQWRDHYLMNSGSFTVSANKEGYQPLHETLEVTNEANQRFQFSLEKLPGILQFELGADVPSARINIGDELQFESTQNEFEVVAGVYKVSIEAPRYQLYETQIEVVGLGKTQIFSVDLRPNWADVSLTSQPTRASVFIGDQRLGETPGTFEILAGEHQLSVKAQGYKRWFKTLNVTAEQAMEIAPIKLVKADGTVVVGTIPAAAIAVDGRYKGISPQTFKLPPGKQYTVTASKVGYQKVSQKITVNSDEDVNLQWQLEALLGDISITGEPASATIWSAGSKVGNMGQPITLSVKDHILQIRADGYASKTITVLPKPGTPQTIQVSLLTSAQAREQELQRKRTVTTSDGQTLLLMRPSAFTMGASRRVRGRRSNEALREVSLVTPYYLATKEVSNAQFKAFASEHSSGSSFKISLDGADQPVVNVSWDQAAQYCNWLSQRDNLPAAYRQENGQMKVIVPHTIGYRLPSEPEWAWAARKAGGRKDTLFPWGESELPPKDFGNFADVSADGLVSKVITDYEDGFATTAPPASYASDVAELYDMAGNVSEWTNDIYRVGDYAPGAAAEARVIRGSSWQHSRVGELRPSYRDFSDEGRADLGFRIARFLE